MPGSKKAHCKRSGPSTCSITRVIAGLPDADASASVTVSLALEVEFRSYTMDGPLGLREGQKDADMMASISTGSRVTTTSVSGEATLDVRVTWLGNDDSPQIDYLDIEYGKRASGHGPEVAAPPTSARLKASAFCP
jgi:hypothetical protein